MMMYRLLWQVCDMKKGIFFYFYYLLALIVVVANGIYIIKTNYFINIESVPDGEYQYNDFSPKKTTELKVYYVDLAVGESVRVTATNNNETKNIFWQTGIEDVKIKWKNDSEVIINNISLDLSKNETFDCRSIRSIFNDGIMGR